MTLGLSVLRNNLQEIYSVVQSTQQTEFQLIANLQGTKTYNVAAGWGRIWKWFYTIIGIFAKNLKTKKLLVAMHKTHEAFNFHLKKVETYLENYKTGLKLLFEGHKLTQKGCLISQNDFFMARKKLTNWNKSTHLFCKLVKNKSSCLVELLEKIFPAFKTEDNLPFHPTASMQEIWKCQKIIDLESHNQGLLPYLLIQKLASNIEFSKEEDKMLHMWVNKLNKSKNSNLFCLFHSTMKVLTSFLKSFFNSTVPADLHNLEFGLIDRGCDLFLEHDPKQSEWRKELQEGDKFICNKLLVILGKQIGAKNRGEDKNIHFEVSNDPNVVFSVAINRALLGIKKSLSQKLWWGLKTVQYYYVDPKGRFALVERLNDGLNFEPGSSLHGISEQDKDICEPIIVLLKWFLKEKAVPQSLSPEFMMFDPMGVLKYLKISMKKELDGEKDFDFILLEEFVFKLAKKNLRIYQYIMQKTGLSEHAYSKYFKKIVENTLNDDKTDAADQASIDKIDDPRIAERGKELKKEVLRKKAKCLEEANPPVSISDKDWVQCINKEISAFYKFSCSSGRLWPTLKKDVVAKLKNPEIKK